MYKFLIILVFLLFLGCVDPFTTKKVDFEVLDRGVDCTHFFKQCGSSVKVIEKKGMLPKELESKVNFDEEMVVLITTERKSTGGYSLDVVEVLENGVLTIKYVETRPGKNCAVIMAFTQPYILIKLPKTNKKVVAIKEVKVAEC